MEALEASVAALASARARSSSWHRFFSASFSSLAFLREPVFDSSCLSSSRTSASAAARAATSSESRDSRSAACAAAPRSRRLASDVFCSCWLRACLSWASSTWLRMATSDSKWLASWAASSRGSSSTVASCSTGRVSTRMAREANSSVESDSLTWEGSGAKQTSMAQREFPDRLLSSMRVSDESRKGTWDCREASDWMTLPSISKLVLMLMASFRRLSCAALFLMRSLPAKSTIVSCPMVCRTFTAAPGVASTLPSLVSIPAGTSCRTTFIRTTQ
mmetsp:Transcript_16797/g.46932  ORF Transcript_16797/g.46932 Transcript_16797/m.46932 type:complete len:275 (-) Transcript_16797:1048-1872(-)